MGTQPGPFRRARLAFRRWRRTRPFWAGIWAMIGGLIVLYGPLMSIKVILVAGQIVWMGILVGALIALAGLFLWFEHGLSRLLGVLIVLLGLVSLITSDFGGFIIGMLFSLVGGSMAFAWRPLQRQRAEAPAKVERRGEVKAQPVPQP
jgi:uncharacterized protein DUF6114